MCVPPVSMADITNLVEPLPRACTQMEPLIVWPLRAPNRPCQSIQGDGSTLVVSVRSGDVMLH